MSTLTQFLLIALCAVAATSAYENSEIVSARIETCRGCSLNRLPDVKKFVMNDAPLFEGLEVKFITGAPPELVLLGSGDQELARVPLSNLSRDACNELVQSKGFIKKKEKEEF